MSLLIDQIADLTELRDRDALDVALVRMLSSVLPARGHQLTIYRPVGDESDLRWLHALRFTSGASLPVVTAPPVPVDSLPKVTEMAALYEAIQSGKPVTSTGGACVTVLPISALHVGLGVLQVDTDSALSPELVEHLRAILRIYHNFYGLLDYGERDSLTNLLNRKTFDGTFLKRTLALRPAAVVTRDERRGADKSVGHWLGVLDIDHFKRVNDNFGHLIGDEVLILMAQLMRSSFRFDDTIYRFGGEEFAVLIRCDTEPHAVAAFERFRASAEARRFPQVGQITVSIGITALRPDDTPSAAFERADKAVYYAKGHGRNQVCNFHDLVRLGHAQDDSAGDTDAEFF